MVGVVRQDCPGVALMRDIITLVLAGIVAWAWVYALVYGWTLIALGLGVQP